MVYIIGGPRFIIHRAHDESVARAIVSDLATRYPDDTASYEPFPDQDCLSIDFGGVSCSGMADIDLDILGRKVHFRAHHLMDLMDALNQEIAQPRTGGFIKIHHWHYATCLELGVAVALRNELKARWDEFVALEKSSFEAWKRGIQSLADYKGVDVQTEMKQIEGGPDDA